MIRKTRPHMMHYLFLSIFSIIEEGFHGCDDELLQLIDKIKNDNGCGYDDDDIEMILHLRAKVNTRLL